jgi:hypothetical protein
MNKHLPNSTTIRSLLFGIVISGPIEYLSFFFLVIDILDELKKEQREARDAIRWLENQFRLGNRYLKMI